VYTTTLSVLPSPFATWAHPTVTSRTAARKAKRRGDVAEDEVSNGRSCPKMSISLGGLG
jgi:hypothetical protein